jgi:hypothetical protein
MKISWDHPALDPGELYELLRKHTLIPKMDDMQLLAGIKSLAQQSAFLMVVDDSGVLATTLTRKGMPGVLDFLWIPEVRGLSRCRDELIDLGAQFREIWFKDGIRRVESRIPLSRRQTVKALHYMGFVEETGSSGLRDAVDYGKGPEAIAIMGLLESDPARLKTTELEVVKEDAIA